MAKQNEHHILAGSVLYFAVDDLLITSMYADLEDAGIRVFKTDDANEALTIAAVENINIVLIDYDPEKHEDIAFLLQVKAQFPMINRMALSENIHRTDIFNLLLDGIITSYFEKPGGLEVLLSGFFRIFYACQKLREGKLLGLLDSAARLATLPEVYENMLTAIDFHSPLEALSPVIEKDVSLTVRILGIANADFFRVGRIGSIARAGLYLGLETIKKSILAISTSQFEGLTTVQKENLREIIGHSVRVNQQFAETYEKNTGQKLGDQYSTPGITHDIGKMIMLHYLPERFAQVCEYQEKNRGMGFYESEMALGFKGQTHAEIGAYFLDLWNFPEVNIYAALHHHTPENASESYREFMSIFSLVHTTDK